MAKKAKFIEGNRLHELPDIPQSQEEAEYCIDKTTYRIIPAPDCKFKVGEVYEEGKDYRIKYERRYEGNWYECHRETLEHPSNDADENRITAIPIIAVPIKTEDDEINRQYIAERKTLEACLSAAEVLKTMCATKGLSMGADAAEGLIIRLKLLLDLTPRVFRRKQGWHLRRPKR